MHSRNFFLLLIFLLLQPTPLQAQDTARPHRVEVGDTWPALGRRYGLDPAALQQANPHLNRQRQPAIGQSIMIPAGEERPQTNGTLVGGDSGYGRNCARWFNRQCRTHSLAKVE